MNDSNDVMKPILIGSGLLLLIVGAIIYAGVQSGHIKAVSEPPKFSVVDTYNENCVVVQYNHPGDAKSHYFLDCSK